MILTHDYTDAAYHEVASGLSIISTELYHLGRTESGQLAYDLYHALIDTLDEHQ